MGSHHSRPTVEEIIALLNKSSLPTLVTEGHDDYLVFRRIEDDLSDFDLDVFPAGSKETVLRLYERRDEIKIPNICFIVDRDNWVFTGVPTKYEKIIMTDGYSVENDLFRDGPVRELMTRKEQAAFDSELRSYVELFALLVDRNLRDASISLAVTPQEFFSSPARQSDLLKLHPNETYPIQLRDECLADYGRVVRGKSLLSLAMRQLSNGARGVKHSKHSVMEQCTIRWGPLMSNLKDKILQSIS